MNNNLHMIVDSISCAMQTNLLEDERVHLLCISARMNDQEWIDGEISSEDLVALIKKEGKLPITSQPPLGEVLDLFTNLVQAGKKVMFITVSSGLSGTYQTAASAAKQVMKENPGSDIRVIDSKTGGLPVADATRLVLEKADACCDDMDELEAYARNLVGRIKSFYAVETLEHLRIGGRIGRASALLGSFLGIRPILTLDEAGKVIPCDKVRSRKKVLKRIMDIASEQGDLETISVMGAMCDEDIAYICSEMQLRHPGVAIASCQIPISLLIHLGPGLIAIFVRVK